MWKWLTQWAAEIAANVRSELSALICCGAARMSAIFIPNPRMTARQGPFKISPKIVASGYLSMNTGAWLPRRGVPSGAEYGNNSGLKPGNGAII
jgi:hypothetical protein